MTCDVRFDLPALTTAADAVMAAVTAAGRSATANPVLMPKDGVEHGPQVESVIRAPGDLRLEQLLEKIVIEIAGFADLRAAIDFQTALAESLVPKPLIHRRAEALLFPIDQIAVNIRFGGLF
jgi:hypothetical protein